MTDQCSTRLRLLLRGCVLLCLLATSLLLTAVALAPAAQAFEQVNACGVQDAGGANYIFSGYETFGIATADVCNQGVNGGLELNKDAFNKVPPGVASGWVATAPPGMTIIGAYVPTFYAYGVVGTGYLIHFYWTGAPPQRIINGPSFSVPVGGMSSAQFGFDLQCNPTGTPCPASNPLTPVHIQVVDVQLFAADIVNPTIVAGGSSNLWNQGSRWLRGNWPLSYSASAPSGIDSMAASENGAAIDTPAAPGCWPDGGLPAQTVWQQCAGSQTWSPTVSLSGNGDQQLVLSATSAAGNVTSDTEMIHVDSTIPAIRLSGPTTAPSTAGTQFVTATATVGPSGLGSISCSTDGAPAQSYSRSPASIPVSGLGMHSVQCTATNRSYNPAGQPATAPTPATWQLDIVQPTVSGIAFAKLVGGLNCTRVRERVKIPATWVAVNRHGKVVKVRRRAHTKIVKAIKCHPRIVERRVTVWVKERLHGRTVRVKRKKVERVVVLPHVVGKASRRVSFGNGTTVSGWLGTSNYTALGGRTVRVLTAPDDGQGAWTQAAAATTTPDGTWSAQLPPGPSRLVVATYDGDVTTESSASTAIHLVVPARVRLRIRPRRVAWGGTIRITGRVLGGYIPRGKLLRLRIGVAGIRETVGIPNVQPNGRFHTTWTFASGSGVVRYWFSISTLSEADYPYATASSRRVYVTVGPG